MAEDAIRDDYEEKYLGGGEDDVTERLAEIDDETADQRAQALLEGLEDYDLDEEDRALLGAWGFDIEEEEEQLADPVVAIVGRPNVGKSTIINRILGRREAVVEDKPGVTRDRVSYKAEWLGKSFTLVDTGGWESDARGIDAQVADQAEIAVEQADVVVLVVDARVGVTWSRRFITSGRWVWVSRSPFRVCTAAAWRMPWTRSWRSCRSTRSSRSRRRWAARVVWPWWVARTWVSPRS